MLRKNFNGCFRDICYFVQNVPIFHFFSCRLLIEFPFLTNIYHTNIYHLYVFDIVGWINTSGNGTIDDYLIVSSDVMMYIPGGVISQ